MSPLPGASGGPPRRPHATTSDLSLPYAGYEALGERPHVMVDGAARPGSVLTLSHWPQSPTPKPLSRDLSTEIVLEFLRTRRLSEPAGKQPRSSRATADVLRAATAAASRAVAVTSDHFDEDGLLGLYAFGDPEAAPRDAKLLVEVAACGDFGVVSSGTDAQICFAIGPLAEDVAGPGSGTSERYAAVLPRLSELLEHPERFERHWAGEWESFMVGQADLDRGAVTIDEFPDVDLAIVRRLDTLPTRVRIPGRPLASVSAGMTPGETGRLPGAAGGLPIHAAVVHSATSASRILAFDGDWCELYLRYEGWVRYVSRQVPLRPDLGPLALQLSGDEPSGMQWEANGVGAIVARLYPSEGRTEIDPTAIVRAVRDYLAAAPPAWDPFREKGGYIPPGERAGYVSPRPPSPGAPGPRSAVRRGRARRHRRA